MIPAKYELLNPQQEEAEVAAQERARILEMYLQPLVLFLDRVLDKRLLRTFVGCCVAIVRFRHPKQGLVLAQLGAYLTSYSGLSQSAAAGTKRVGNLIRSWKWNAGHIEQFLLQEASNEVERLKRAGKRILAIVDGSVIEKPESTSLEATAPAISSQAKRWARSRFGLLFNPPLLRPLRVIGMEWTGSIITGLEGIPHLAVMRFWTRHRGVCAKAARDGGRGGPQAGAHLRTRAHLCL